MNEESEVCSMQQCKTTKGKCDGKCVLCRAAADKGAQEEAERQLAVVKKLKAEVMRKGGMLKATQAELDKVPFQPTLLVLLLLQSWCRSSKLTCHVEQCCHAARACQQCKS